MTETLEQIETESLSALQREHYEQIQALERKCDELETQYEADKAQAATSKKRWEQAVERLRSCIRSGPDPQGKLDFREDWREVPIVEALTLTMKQIETLSDAGVETVGEFENLRAGQVKDYPRGLSDLPRVGESTIDKWEAEIIEWMTANATEDDEMETESDDDSDDQ